MVVRQLLQSKATELMAGLKFYRYLNDQRASLRPLLTARVDPPGTFSALLEAMLYGQARFVETRVRAELALETPRQPTVLEPELTRLGALLCSTVLEDIVGPQDAQRAANLYVVAKHFDFSIK